MELGVKRPLVIDLDGTLIKSDLLVESTFGIIGRNPLFAFKIPFWLYEGKAAFKRRVAEKAQIEVAALPYNSSVLDRIRCAKENGRKVYLASASDELLVSEVATYLGSFDGWFGSDGKTNLSGNAKAARLIQAFGEKNFDYIGDGKVDFPVWKKAATAISVGLASRDRRHLDRLTKNAEHISVDVNKKGLLRLLRPMQWAKNALVGVPVLTAHDFGISAILLAFLAMLAFSACASSVYILNDLVDIQADRGHPTKRHRPFASGDVSFVAGAALGFICLFVASSAAVTISWKFAGVLATYFAVTTAYSLLLKRKLMVDVVSLAGLYTIRVVGGAVAISVPLSEWLLGFSMFIFLFLALIKRYSELALRFDNGISDPTNRDYKVGDLPIIGSLAAASAFSSIIVLTLYLSSDTVRMLYRHPPVLWLTCPLLVYWVSRILILSHRRFMTDDPIVFAIRDRVTWATAALVIACGIGAY